MAERKDLGRKPQADAVSSEEFVEQPGDAANRAPLEHAPAAERERGTPDFPRGIERHVHPDPPNDLDRRVDHQEGIGSRGYELEKDHGRDTSTNRNRGDYAHGQPASPADSETPG